MTKLEKQAAALSKLSSPDLKRKYRDAVGSPAPRSISRAQLIQKILQAQQPRFIAPLVAEATDEEQIRRAVPNVTGDGSGSIAEGELATEDELFAAAGAVLAEGEPAIATLVGEESALGVPDDAPLLDGERGAAALEDIPADVDHPDGPHAAAEQAVAPSMETSASTSEPVVAGRHALVGPSAQPAADACAPSTKHDPRVPPVGTMIRKVYRAKGEADRQLEVTVLDDGFFYDGKRWTSLSAIAQHVTDGSINGYTFFGLGKSSTPRVRQPKTIDAERLKEGLAVLPDLLAAIDQVDVNGMLADPAGRGVEEAAQRIREALPALRTTRHELERALRLLEQRMPSLGDASVAVGQ